MVYLDIEQIKINIDTGITDKKENIILTSKILYHPSIKLTDVSEYPFILSNVIYPIKKLESFFYLKNDYSEKVKFFFNKTYATKILNKLLNNQNTDIPKDKASNETSELDTIFKKNIPFMLQMLFPTSFPYKNNVTTSFDEYILNNTNTESSMSGMFSHNYSYINVNSKKYTVLKVIWLNDMVNHTLYKDMISAYNDYKNWSSNTIEKLINKNNANEKSLLDKMKKSNSIYNIESYKEKFEDNKPKDTANPMREGQQIIVGDDKKKEFYENIENIVAEIKTLYTSLKTTTNSKNVLSNMNMIKEYFKKLQGNSRVQLKIDSDFIKKVDRIISELETLNNFNTIKRYLDINEINKNFEKEESSVKSELQKFPKFIEFVNKLKSIMVSKSSNSDLNDIIRNYYENIPENVDTKFNDLMNNTIDHFIELKNVPIINTKLLNVGANIIIEKTTYKQSYEIFIAVDLLEGEFNDSNINNIKCNYRGLLLGNLAENYIEKNNNYINSMYQLFVPEIKKENPQNPQKEKIKKENPQNPQKEQIKKENPQK